jgi:MGT family glycosyltransferase
MAHVGILCPPVTGHINSLTPLGIELQKRGHAVTFVQVADTEAKIRAAGLGCAIAGQADFPLGTLPSFSAQLGALNGIAAGRYTVEIYRRTAEMMLRDVPALLRQLGVEGLIVDQTQYEGATIAELTNLPFVTFCSALPLNYDWTIPPFATDWPYSISPWAQLRNRFGYEVMTFLGRPIGQSVQHYRQAHGLMPHTEQPFSQLAQISQQPAAFEYPRQLPPYFHFTGPHHYAAPRELDQSFPFAALTEAPLIYASMGTLQNRLQWVFQRIAEACEGLPAQLVISLGNARTERIPQFPGNPMVVPYAPQLELLKRAALTITHGGLNTTLETLSNGVPLVAIPVTNDQPAVAARIVWSGAGEKLSLSGLSVSRLRDTIERVLTQASYRQNAHRLQGEIQRAGGVVRAAEIVERAITTRKPVLSRDFEAHNSP